FRTTAFLQWGHTAPLWPLIAGVGFCLAARWIAMAALLAGLLAAMNPGWLVLLPVAAALLWREQPRARGLLLVLLLAPPILAWGGFRFQVEEMLRGILGSLFDAGNRAADSDSWRYPSLHAVG